MYCSFSCLCLCPLSLSLPLRVRLVWEHCVSSTHNHCPALNGTQANAKGDGTLQRSLSERKEWRKLYMRKYRAQARKEDDIIRAHVSQVEADNRRLKAAVVTLTQETELLRSLLSDKDHVAA